MNKSFFDNVSFFRKRTLMHIQSIFIDKKFANFCNNLMKYLGQSWKSVIISLSFYIVDLILNQNCLQSLGNFWYFVSNWLNIIHGLKKIDFSCKKGKIMYNSICLKPGSNYLVIRHLYHIKHDIWQSWNIFSPLYYSILCLPVLPI